MIPLGLILNSLILWFLFCFVGEKIYSRFLVRFQGPESHSESPTFFRALPTMLGVQFLKLSLEPLSIERLKGLPKRWQLFLIATQSLSLVGAMGVSLFFTFIFPLGFYWGEILAKAAMELVDYHWIFWLSTNYFLGTVYGMAFAILWRCFFRQTGNCFWIAIQGLLSGVLSLGFAWGVVLGDILVGFLFGLWQNRSSLDFRWRYGISIGISSLIFLVSPWLQNLVQFFWFEVTPSELRVIHLMILATGFLGIDIAANSLFFHFRWRQYRGG